MGVRSRKVTTVYHNGAARGQTRPKLRSGYAPSCSILPPLGRHNLIPPVLIPAPATPNACRLLRTDQGTCLSLSVGLLMPKRERDEAVAELVSVAPSWSSRGRSAHLVLTSRVCMQSSTVFATMLEEILMDVVQQSHQEIARARAVCDVCHTRCVPQPLRGGSYLLTCIQQMRSGCVTLAVQYPCCAECWACIQPVHVPGPSNGVASGSRISTPSGEAKHGERNSPSGTGVNTPVNGKDGTTYFECLECNRQVSPSTSHSVSQR